MADNRQNSTATAGLRGASWDAARLPSDLQTSVHALTTGDSRQVLGFLYRRDGSSRGVVCIMHPRELVPTHYLVPDVLAAGFDCWVQGSRSPGNDLRLEHETALLDVAAGQVFLRGAGYRTVILLGNSGGAALFALYVQQSQLDPPRRIARTPAGRPTQLEGATLPAVDALILISPHLGPGKLLQAAIDPAVTSEADPLGTDDALSAFSMSNGYRSPPERTEYSPAFVVQYRAAQLARVTRIDAYARQLLSERKTAREQAKADGGPDARIRAAYMPIFHVWRTDADLRCIDLSLDPSDRRPGSLWGSDLVASNYGCIGFARSCTAESWLSSWSGISSNASFEKCGSAIGLPTLMIDYTGDPALFPQDADFIFDSMATRQKERHRVRGNHHGQALVAGEPSGQALCGAQVQQWLNTHFSHAIGSNTSLTREP